MHRRKLWALTILVATVFLLAEQANAYIQDAISMKRVLQQTPFIFTAKIENFDAEKRTAVFAVDENLKGKVTFQKLYTVLPEDKEGSREYNKASHLVKRLATNLPVVFFADAKAAMQTGAFAPVRRGNMVLFLYTNGTWVQFAAETEEGQTRLPIKFHHFEPYLRRTFKGTTAEMRQVIIDGLAGKKEPPGHDPNEPGGLGPEVKQ